MIPAYSQKTPTTKYYLFELVKHIFLHIWELFSFYHTHTGKKIKNREDAYSAVCAQKAPIPPMSSLWANKHSHITSLRDPDFRNLLPAGATQGAEGTWV